MQSTILLFFLPFFGGVGGGGEGVEWRVLFCFCFYLFVLDTFEFLTETNQQQSTLS